MTSFGLDYMWEHASGAHETLARTSSLVRGKVASAAWWPFLSSATSETDFDNRLSLVAERIEAAVDPEVYDDVISSLRDDFRAVAGYSDTHRDVGPPGRKMREKDYSDAEIRQAHLDADAEEAAERRVMEHDSALEREFYDHQTGKWVTATNYQRDPNAGWRYHYPNLNGPVNNGDLQDADGFPKDLAEGEDRSQPKLEWQSTPQGEWQVVPGTGAPVRPMPFSEQRGYVPMAKKKDNTKHVCHNCHGTGDIYGGKCPRCDGSGFVHGSQSSLQTEANKYIKQQGGKWVITQKGTGKVLSHHDSEEEAEASFRAMMQSKHGSVEVDSEGFLAESAYTVGPPVVPGGNHKVYEDGREIGGFLTPEHAREVARESSDMDYAHIKGMEHADQGIYANPYTPGSLTHLQYERGVGGYDRTGFHSSDPLYGQYDEAHRTSSTHQAAWPGDAFDGGPFNTRSSDSIYCNKCGGQGMVRAGGVVRNCPSCKGSGIKRAPRKQIEKDLGEGFLGDFASSKNAVLNPLFVKDHSSVDPAHPDFDRQWAHAKALGDFHGYMGRPAKGDEKYADLRYEYPNSVGAQAYDLGWGNGNRRAEQELALAREFRHPESHVASLRVDADGFLVEASDVAQEGVGGRANSPLVDPAPGTPQKVNPFYFNSEDAAMGSNEGFPVEPQQDPLDRVNEIYGEGNTPAPSVQDTSNSVDGKGYSRANPGESPDFSAGGKTAGKYDYPEEVRTPQDRMRYDRFNLTQDGLPGAGPAYRTYDELIDNHVENDYGDLDDAGEREYRKHKDHYNKTASKIAAFDDNHVTRYVNWAKENGHDPDEVSTLKRYEKEPGIGRSHTNYLADQLYIGGGDIDWRRSASKTAGNEMVHCTNPNCTKEHWAGPDGKRYGSPQDHRGQSSTDVNRLPLTAAWNNENDEDYDPHPSDYMSPEELSYSHAVSAWKARRSAEEDPHSSMSPEERAEVSRRWGLHESSTDGKIVDHCPGCDKPRRVHDTPHGQEVRHIHNNHVRCHGSKTASGDLAMDPADDEPNLTMPNGNDINPDFDSGLRQTSSLPQFFDPHEAVLPNGGNFGGHDAPLSFAEALDYNGGYGIHTADQLSNGTTHTAGDYLGRPDATNPTGRGPDEYRARTWDAYQTTKPMQTPEERNVNTPVLPERHPAGPNINTPTPGLKPAGQPAEQDDDEDEDDDD